MRKITIRQFQRNFYKEIKNLPILIARRGKNFFVVQPVKTDFVGTPNSVVTGLKEKETPTIGS